MGHFHGVQFSQKASLQISLIFADVCTHAHYTLYNCAYFTGLIFVDSGLSAKISRYTVCMYACMYIHMYILKCVCVQNNTAQTTIGKGRQHLHVQTRVRTKFILYYNKPASMVREISTALTETDLQ